MMNNYHQQLIEILELIRECFLAPDINKVKYLHKLQDRLLEFKCDFDSENIRNSQTEE